MIEFNNTHTKDLEELLRNRFDINNCNGEEEKFLLYIKEKDFRGAEVEKGLLPSGGIASVIGHKGARKSSMCTMFVAASLSPEKTFFNIKSDVMGSVLWIDTEMPGNTFKRFQKKMYYTLGWKDNHPSYTALNFNSLAGYKKKFQQLLFILKENLEGNLFSDLQLIILDGIAQLIKTTESEEEMKSVLDELKYYLNKSQLGIVNVLHTNRASTGPRGQAGSMVENDCHSVIKLKKDNDTHKTLVTCDKIRGDADFNSFLLYHDTDSKLVIDLDTTGSTPPSWAY